MQPLFLKIFHRGSLLRTRPFVDDQISIGSGEGLNLQLEGLSPWHVLIEKKSDKYFVFDLGSEEGTYLNGERITGEVEITSGSTLKLGEYEIQFFVGAPQDVNVQKPSPQTVKEKVEVPSFPQKEPMDSPSASKVSVKEPMDSPSASKVSVTDTPPAKDYKGKTGQYKKPDKKGYWKTFAPPSKISNLDDYLEPSIGNLIEVVVAWKERVLSTYHFYKNDTIYMGSDEDCQIPVPNLLGVGKYKLLKISGGAQVCLNDGVQGTLIQGKDKSTRVTHPLNTAQIVNLKPYEMVKLDFKNAVKVYVRIVQKPSKLPFIGLFNLNFSETVSLFLSVLLTAFLIFYAGFYGPAFLLKDDKFLEKDIRIATVKFDRAPKPQVVDYKLGDKNRKPKIVQKKLKIVRKKPKLRIPKVIPKKKVRRTNIKKRGKIGKIAAQAPGKKPRSKKVTVGSVRPGGSLKTGKAGSSAKTVAPDPSKVGLLGVFGGGGQLDELDKGASGAGGLVGLAEESTGYAGTKDAYSGKGIGTKTKEVGSGGKGSSLVGISGIKTKGRGASTQAGTGTGGLGKRGRMSIEFGEDDIDVEGEIDRAGILRVLRQNKVKFDNCYQFSLQQQSSLQGSLKMQWEILPNGNVRSAFPIDDKVGSKALSDCVAKILKRLNFPAPPSGQIPRVAFSFVFSI